MISGFRIALAASVALMAVASPIVVSAQTPPAAVAEWRTIAPENLLVIDSAKGRILVELEPRAAPVHVNRVRTLADSGFYDGLKFHRVIAGFMAQTGDPLGTGAGGSDLPDIPAELTFRRGRDSGFAPVAAAGEGLRGLMGTLPIVTQPDAQMFVTADFKVDAGGLFCPGVAGMARSSALDSANSQFFLMTGVNNALNGAYTSFGRVVVGLDVVKALKAGPAATDGAVTENPDVMTRVRTAAALPEAARPAVRVMDARAPAFAQLVETTRAAKGAGFNICDIQPPAEVTGG